MTEQERGAIIWRLEAGCSFADDTCEVVDIAQTDRVMRMAADYIDDDGKRIEQLEAQVKACQTALASIAEPRIGGGEWAASVARKCLTAHLAENATIDDLALPMRLKKHLGSKNPATLVIDILANKDHPLWGNISHRDERIMWEIAEFLDPECREKLG